MATVRFYLRTIAAVFIVTLCVSSYVAYLYHEKNRPKQFEKLALAKPVRFGTREAVVRLESIERRKFGSKLQKLSHRNLCDSPTKVGRSLDVQKDSFHFLPQFKNPCYLHVWEEEFMRERWKGFPEIDSYYAYRPLSHSKYKKLVNKSSDINVRFSSPTSRGDQTRKKGCQHEYLILRCLPYYYIIGFSYTGGHSLQELLVRDPAIAAPNTNKLHWFSSARFGYYNRSPLQNYFNEFSNASYEISEKFRFSINESRIHIITGDPSMNIMEQWKGYRLDLRYQNTTMAGNPVKGDLFAYSSPLLIKSFLPDSRFIVMLRNPIDRIKAMYIVNILNTSVQDFHAGVRNGIEWWQSCVSANRDHIQKCMYGPYESIAYNAVACGWRELSIQAIRTSIYHLFIREWLTVFHRHQFLFIDDYEFKSKPQSTLEVVYNFLDVQQSDLAVVSNSTTLTKNSSTTVDLSLADSTLSKFFRSHNSRLLPLIDDKVTAWPDWMFPDR